MPSSSHALMPPFPSADSFTGTVGFDPGVNDDALVQDTIDNIEETCAAGCPFNGYRSSVSFMKFVGPAAGALSAPPREGQPSAR